MTVLIFGVLAAVAAASQGSQDRYQTFDVNVPPTVARRCNARACLFTIEGMSLIGRYDNVADLGRSTWSTATARKPASPEWPSYVVVRFP